MRTEAMKARTPWGAKQQGFTLIELMIVVVVVAILAAIAFPQYRDYVVRSNRAVAKSLLTQVADRQEQFYVANKAYAGDLTDLGYPAATFVANKRGSPSATDPAGDALYTIALDASTATTFTVSATPRNAQTQDAKCTKFTLNQAGQRQAEGSTAADCW
jgi:type IV pilus assembly protein PilE